MVWAAEVAPEVICIHHETFIFRRLSMRSGHYFSKNILKHLSKYTQLSTFSMVGAEYSSNRKEIKHELLVALIELCSFQDKT